ncbi:MAG: thioredoxin family protein [Bacteroidales bacterium]|nr:thioredoxin family protein [Bacteroidales bacterium]MBQ9722149.1 thioredoxin family protein [Bacteroidales bacterium]
MMKRFLTMLAAALISVAAFAQLAPSQIITWTPSVQTLDGDVYRVVFTGKVAAGYHTYTLTDEFSATAVMDPAVEGGELVGEPYELSTPKEEIDEFGEQARHYYDEIIIAQDVKVASGTAVFTGTIFSNACTGGACKAEYYDFDVKVGKSTAVAPASYSNETTAISSGDEKSEERDGSIWGLILEAILWGFAMLLTPCVFPMVPMTVSFFMKGSGSVAQGRFKAGMYGLFIVLLYTVPISVIILLTRIIGGDAVTADIFNWLATHWLPNIIFFIVFMVFAASFFGAFEITLPQSLVNKSDKGSDKKGLAGVFFMALTLVLVSFSCTGPIVGSVLIKSTQGEFWEPMVTMLAFSLAFALPFTVLAFSPSLLKKFKQSGGGWLNSVKVVLGFVEIALGLKFLSVADQTYHWGILDREVYLAIWIVVFTLLGLYLLGKIRFENDEPVEHLSVPRLTLAIAVFSFVVYLIPGMWGAPLKALSGYMPPISTQDFVIGQGTAVIPDDSQNSTSPEFGLHLPHGLQGYFTLDEGLEAAKKAGKPVFVDVTGHGCVNCREMEARVWSDPKVLDMLRNEFVIVALYNDDKQKLDKEDWVTDAQTGKVYKDLGRANSYIARSRWDVNAQPNYVLLSPDGEMLVPVRGYDLSIDGFVNFLQSGIDAYRK